MTQIQGINDKLMVVILLLCVLIGAVLGLAAAKGLNRI